MLKNNTLPFLFLAITLFCCLNSSTAASSTYNVIKFGAKPDGKTDSTKAFLNAWTKACSSPYPATIYVPQGKFLLGTTIFSGKCTNKAISITIDGTLVASSDYRVIGKSGNWLKFQHVDGISIRGGVLDGQGTALWDCKNSDKSNCPTGATVMFIMHWHFGNAHMIFIFHLNCLILLIFNLIIKLELT
jgi:polygalacturonase